MRVRRAVERVIGEEKVWHRLDRLRYDGRARAAIQACLTTIVFDVKKMARRLALKRTVATGTAAFSGPFPHHLGFAERFTTTRSAKIAVPGADSDRPPRLVLSVSQRSR
jgi:hypothetical protein